VEDNPAHVASSHGSGHDQGGGGQLGVVMFADGEADEATGGQVLDGGQVELAFVGSASSPWSPPTTPPAR